MAFSLRSLGTNVTPIDLLDIPEEQKQTFLNDTKIPGHWKKPIQIPKRVIGSPIVRVCKAVGDMGVCWEKNELMKPPESVGPDLALPVNFGGAKVLLSIQAKPWVSKAEVNDAIEKSSPLTDISRLKAIAAHFKEKAKTTPLTSTEKGQLTMAGSEIPLLENFKPLVGNVDTVGCLRLVVISSPKDFFGGERLRFEGNDLIILVGPEDLSKLVGSEWQEFWAGLLRDKQRFADASLQRKTRKLDEEEAKAEPAKKTTAGTKKRGGNPKKK